MRTEKDLLKLLQKAHDHLWDFRRRMSFRLPKEKLTGIDADLESLKGIVERTNNFVADLPQLDPQPSNFKAEHQGFWLEHHTNVRAQRLKDKMAEVKKELADMGEEAE
jgi:hypothetical protein